MLGYCPAKATTFCDAANPANGEAWHYAYDAMGRQTKTIPPDNVGTDLNTSETVFDAGGRVDTVCSHPAGMNCSAATSVLRTLTPAATAYDKLWHLLSSTTYRDTSSTKVGSTANTYNADGSLASTTAVSDGVAAGTVLGNSDTVTFTYDAQGRPDEVKRGATTLTEFEYVTAVAGYGQLASRDDGGTGDTVFAYDWASRLTETDGPTTGTGDLVTQAWRLDGLLASRTIPTSPADTAAVGYDPLKRPVTITRTNGDTLSRAYARSGATRSDGRSLTGSGAGSTGTASYLYNALGQLVEESGVTAAAISYGYDPDGNRTSRAVAGGATTTWAYERTDQVTSETEGSTTTTFGYDPFGNLTSKAEPGGSTVTTMAYADGSRMSGYRAPGAAADTTFAYDALGRTALRTDPAAVTETFDFVGTSETVWRSTPSAGSATTSVVDPGGSRLSVTKGGVTGWTLFDHLGSLAALVAPDASLSASYRFDGWGNAITTLDRSANPYGFRGSVNLGTDGEPLYEMGARHYAPSVGVFTQQDSYAGSALDPFSLNRFLYAHANPTSLIDPTGHNAIVEDGLIIRESSLYAKPIKKTVKQRFAERRTGRRTVADVRRSTTASCRHHGCESPYRRTPTASRWDLSKTLNAEASSTVPAFEENQNRWKHLVSEAKAHAQEVGYVYKPPTLHDALDEVGLAPGLGIFADIPNAGLYALEGDWGNALLSGAGVFALGDVAKYGVKGARGLQKALDAACSFTPGTLVATPTGDVPIGKLGVGDEVIARDEATGVTATRTVEAVLIHDDPVTGTVVIDGESVATTPEHPYFSLDRGFVLASELELGELVASERGHPGRVDAVAWDGGPQRMWNLTVAVDHTFFVGEGRWWVHNDCNIDPRQLQSKFKHAEDFGIPGSWNKHTAGEFAEALQRHVEAFPPEPGSLRRQSGQWHLDPETNLGVFVDDGNNFVSGWKLSEGHLRNFPHVGGG